MDKGRAIIIGDIHGCYQEFEDLLNLVNLQNNDRVYLLGDLINRGPDSHKVVKIAREINAKGVVGNHELRLYQAYCKKALKKPLRSFERTTLHQLSSKDWDYLKALTPTIVLPDYHAILVHAGFDPSKKWKNQKLSVITKIQVLDDKGNPSKRSICPNGIPWADKWDGPFVYYGHTPKFDPYFSENALGLDTGCVVGNRLSAYILPDRKVVQVSARKVYFKKETPLEKVTS